MSTPCGWRVLLVALLLTPLVEGQLVGLDINGTKSITTYNLTRVGCNQSHSWSFSTDGHVSYTCYRALAIGVAVGGSAIAFLALCLYRKIQQSEELGAVLQGDGKSPQGAVAQAVEPKAVAPVAEPVNRNARDKVVVAMCCVQTRPMVSAWQALVGNARAPDLLCTLPGSSPI